MKKYWYIVIAVAAVLLVTASVYMIYQSKHPDSSYDAIPRELRKEMLANWPAERFGKRFLDGSSTIYYGTHGDCVAFYSAGEVGMSVAYGECEFEVAGSKFWYSQTFFIMVYHDGEFVHLREAYQRGWLNRWQIASIAQYHQQRVNDKFGEDVYA